MIQVIQPDNDIFLYDKNFKKDKIFIFLAGPIQGAPDYKSTIIKHPKFKKYEDKIIFIDPKRKKFDASTFDYNSQVSWETRYLRMSDIVLFWIPEEVEKIPGRDYAQTTRVEFLECLARKKKIAAGMEETLPLRKYMDYKFKYYQGKELAYTLEETINQCTILIDKIVNTVDKICFTSDTHFSQQRTLDLSRRPFIDTFDMDEHLIENWNNTVSPFATVYHLGDFGDLTKARYLNGNIILIMGNYEYKDAGKDVKAYIRNTKKQYPYFQDILEDKPKENTVEINNETVYMTHKPVNCIKDKWNIFGHIHGRNMMKEYGFDVGVDAHNYTPLTLRDAQFFLNALQQGYYDDNVFQTLRK